MDLNEAIKNFEFGVDLSSNDVIPKGRYERSIIDEFSNFQDTLDNDHFMVLSFSGFGTSGLMIVDNIYMISRELICFYGHIGNEKTEIIQHISQINVRLISVKNKEPDLPPRRVGFEIPNP